MRDDFLCQRTRIFAALFPKHESNVGLVIAKPRIGRLRQFADVQASRRAPKRRKVSLLELTGTFASGNQ